MDGATHREEVLVELTARRNRLWNVFAIHQAVAGAKNPLLLLLPRLSRWSAEFDAVSRAGHDSWSLSQRAAPLAMQIDDLEREAMDADARVRPAAFRRGFDAALIEDERLADYLSLLSARTGRNIEQRDRFLSLARRLLVTTTAEGSRVLGRGEAGRFLRILSAGIEVNDQSRRSAESFFHDSMLRLHAVSSFAEILEGGLLVDVIGYKLTLRGEIADPEILHGLVALEVALDERLEDLCALEGLPRGEATWHAWKIALRMQRTFRKTTLFETTATEASFQTIDWRRYYWRLGMGPLKLPAPTAARWTRSAVLLLALTAVLAVWAGREIGFDRFHHATLSAIGGGELNAISPILATGGLSEDARVFIGTVSSKWKSASAAERKEAARAIAAGLSRRQVEAAIITLEGAPVIQIEREVVKRVVLPEGA